MFLYLNICVLIRQNILLKGPVSPIEITPIVPPMSGEQLPEDSTRYYLDCLLEFLVSQVSFV